MPRVKVMLPDPLLQVAADQAHAAGKKIDDLYEAAIVEFIEANQHTRPGALRNRGAMPASSPKLTIEISEKVFQDAEKLAKRLGKRRDVIYALALYKHVKYERQRPERVRPGPRPARGRVAAQRVLLATSGRPWRGFAPGEPRRLPRQPRGRRGRARRARPARGALSPQHARLRADRARRGARRRRCSSA